MSKVTGEAIMAALKDRVTYTPECQPDDDDFVGDCSATLPYELLNKLL